MKHSDRLQLRVIGKAAISSCSASEENSCDRVVIDDDTIIFVLSVIQAAVTR